MSLGRLAKRALARAGDLLPGAPRSRVVYFHSLGRGDRLTQPPEDFRDQLHWLRDHGYRAVLAHEVPALAAAPSADPWVCLTFDDGYADNVEVALPILEELGMPATFFVVSGMVGEPGCRRRSCEGNKLYPDRTMMTSDEVADLAARGMEVGSHNHHHRLATDDASAFRTDLRRSLELLSGWTGSPVRSFSYPNGQRGAFSAATRAALTEAGIDAAFTTLWGGAGPAEDPLALPRCEVPPEGGLREFEARMLGRRDYFWVLHRLRRGADFWGVALP